MLNLRTVVSAQSYYFWRVRILTFIFLFSLSGLSAQNAQWSIEGAALAGFMMPHHEDMEYLVDGHVVGGELTASKTVDGSKDWHHRFLFPQWGVSVSGYDLGSEYLGNGLSGRVFLDLPLTKSRKWYMKISFGAGFIDRPFDEDNNVRNSAIGSKLNASIGIETHYDLKLSERLTFQPGIGIHHYSNGAFQMPNSGINLALLRLGVSYDLSTKTLPELEVKEFTRESGQIWFGLSGGMKEIQPIGGPKYAIINAYGIYQKRISGKSTFGGEIGLNYNESLQFKNDESEINGPDSRDNYRPYIAALYQLHFDPLLLRFSLGSYVAPRFTDDGMIFLRYHIVYEKNRFQFFIGLKSHYAKADNVEIGTAFRLK
jgi:hypothetical protein